MTSLWTGKGPSVSIRFKVILPYLLLTLIVAVTGAYIVTRLVSSSLNERLTNQLIESGRVISDTMARQEIKQLESARLIAYTRGLGDAIRALASADVVHAHGALYAGSIHAARLARRDRVPLVVTEHVGFVDYRSRLVNAVESAAWAMVGDRVISEQIVPCWKCRF